VTQEVPGRAPRLPARPSHRHQDRLRPRTRPGPATAQAVGEELEDGVGAAGGVVVLVRVAGQDAVDAAADHLQEGVLGEVGVARVVQGVSESPGASDVFVELADGSSPVSLESWPGDGSRTSGVRTDAATPLNQPSQPALGDRLTAVFQSSVAPTAAPCTALPGEAAFASARAAGVGLNRFNQHRTTEGQPSGPATPASKASAAVHNQADDHLFADLGDEPLAEVRADPLALGPAG